MAKKKVASSYEAMLIESAREALAIARGEMEPARVTEREAFIARPPAFGPRSVRRARDRLGFSQAVFARALNVSAATVRSWEQGQRAPDGAAVRLLEMTVEHPELFRAKLRRVSERSPRYSGKKRPASGT